MRFEVATRDSLMHSGRGESGRECGGVVRRVEVSYPDSYVHM